MPRLKKTATTAEKKIETKEKTPRVRKPRAVKVAVIKKTVVIESAKEAPQAPAPITSMKYISSLGRRKTSVACIKLFTVPGEGKIEINNKSLEKFFPVLKLQNIVKKPLELYSVKNLDVQIRVQGGGPSGQAGSICLAISRALEKLNPEMRPLLRAHGLLTVDSRNKERKKYGLKRARKAPQWQKR